MARKTRIEPGLLIIFRYFLIIAIAYFAILVTLSSIQTNILQIPYLRWSFLNFLLYLILYAYLSIPWLRERNPDWYLPLALAMAAGFPVLANVMSYLETSDRTLSVLIQGSWLSFPVLLVPLVILAWQYPFRYVLLFTVLAAAAEEILLIPLLWPPRPEQLTVVGQPLIRAFSFGIVGHIVCHLMETQRAQRRRLMRANLELIRNADAQQRLAVSHERNRLARELHDTLAHSLTALSVSLEAMKTELASGGGECPAMLERALRIARDGLTDTRRALKSLRADALDDLGLPLAVRNLAEAAAERSGLRLDCQIEESLPALPEAAEHALYRIAQESLDNAVHHAGAGSLRVELAARGGAVEFAVRDDGSGFDPERIDEQDHYGIRGMRERAQACGGALEIESRKDEGTALRVRIPVGHDPRSDL
ncbi:MAG: sensor histidine kinase [Anaerolineales bacterium]|nr:sensor histidine kinase [Anaerolineales bacterium]